MSVKVGVRVRPFNKRQQQLQCRRCVQMQGQTTRLIQADGTVKNFVYDYSFWSHDKFMTDADGVNIPVDDKYADQNRVYKECGSDILVNAWQGYNCCLFAYGQTGSGKSYSMIGYGANRGIIPIVCDQIFKKIEGNVDTTKSFQVMISMMEIYNETVRDLLQKNKSKQKQLKICESKKLGVYVEGLYKHPVHNYQQIAKKIQEGSNNRSIAATLMNESSSRSHTIVSINFVQKIQVSSSQTSIKYSVIHLVDLAGSECVAKTGVDSKDRLRQTAKINQSLSTLGRVIEILADNASGKEKQFVPYRDSKLTFILRNALGGNSRTTMICAISPADDNIQQTLSTLRYASRAKKIQNKALVNESDIDKLIRMLREENEYLKKMLQEAKFTKTVINQEVISNYNRMSQNMAELGISCGDEELLLDEIVEMDESDKSVVTADDEEEQQVEGKLLDDSKQKLSLPYITNISEDQLLSFRVKYNCEDLMIGNKHGNPKPDVVLAALGIQPNHARIYIDGQQNSIKKVYLQILSEQAEDYTYVNGQNISFREKKELFDNDRLIFGTGCIFLVVIFGGRQRTQALIKIEDIDYQFAIKEMQNVNLDRSRVLIGQSQEELRKKIVSEMEKQYEDVKKENEENMKKQIQQQELEYQQRIKQIQSKKNEQTQRLKLQLQRKALDAKKLEQEKNRVREQIEKYRQMQKEMQLKMIQKLEQQKLKLLQNQQESKQEQARKQQQAEEQLQKTNKILLDKLGQISLLQKQISQINLQNQQKQLQIKYQLQKQQQMVQKQLEIKTIMCQNQNIITEYRLELAKKVKNAKQLRDLLVKKEKGFLQKQLVELVPMIEKFNLMGKEMNRRIQAGLSIEYKYISESQIIEALKNNTYKSKLKILIHVINKEEGRGYYWSTQVFRNRFEHAIDAFELFISKNHLKQRLSTIYSNKHNDPYWEPEKFQVYALSYASMECLLYQFAFSSVMSIVSQGHKLGEMEVSLWPLTTQGGNLVRFKESTDLMKIFNPRDLIERSLSFELEIKHINIHSELNLQKIRIEYEILESNYKVRKYQTQDILFSEAQKFTYSKHHTISEISQNTILHYTDRPVCFTISAIIKLTEDDELTNRDSFMSGMSGSKVSSFAGSTNSFANQCAEEENQQAIFKTLGDIDVTKFSDLLSTSALKKKDTISIVQTKPSPMAKKTGAIVENVEIMSKIQNDYLRKKRESNDFDQRKRKENQKSFGDDKKKKKKDQNCVIF